MPVGLSSEFERDGKYIVFELNNNGIFAIEKV